MSEHEPTPVPWSTGRADLQSYLIDGTPVVYVYRDPEPRIAVLGEKCREDAEFVVRAANNHEGLILAGKTMLGALRRLPEGFFYDLPLPLKERLTDGWTSLEEATEKAEDRA